MRRESRRQRARYLIATVVAAAAPAVAAAAPPLHTHEVLSQVYSVDRKYKSMEGPLGTQPVRLLDVEPPELLWITGFRTEMVMEDGTTPTKAELMCHVNLDLDLARHHQIFGPNRSNSRLLTLSQGQLAAQLPSGFGVPIHSSETLSLTTQVLNLNDDTLNARVRHKVSIEFVRDADLDAPLRPLFNTPVYGLTSLADAGAHFGRTNADPAAHGESCMPGAQAPNAGIGSTYEDALGQKFTGHWIVQPGREVKHTNVTKILNLPYDTTLHYAAVHLHPFARSLTLNDLTDGRTVFESRARNPEQGIGLDHVDAFSSAPGVPIHAGHEYELVSIYDNTTPDDQDSMAVALLFLEDKTFRHPLARRAAPPPVESDTRLVLTTLHGPLTLVLYPESAPKTVAQIIALAKAGIFDGMHFYRVHAGYVAQTSRAEDRLFELTPKQQAVITRLPAEIDPTLIHERGVLSMAHEDGDLDSAEASFSIVLGNAPHLDGKYAIFGRVVGGEEVLAEIERTSVDAQYRPLTRVTIFDLDALGARSAKRVSRGRPATVSR